MGHPLSTRIKGQLRRAAKFFEFLPRNVTKVALRMKVKNAHSNAKHAKTVAELPKILLSIFRFGCQVVELRVPPPALRRAPCDLRKPLCAERLAPCAERKRLWSKTNVQKLFFEMFFFGQEIFIVTKKFVEEKQLQPFNLSTIFCANI